MTTGAKLTLGGLGVVLLFFIGGTTLVPTHVRLGAGPLRCGTVAHPDTAELGDLCAKAGAHQLRTTFGLAGVLAALALAPLLVGRSRRPVGLWIVWAGAFALSTLLSVVFLAYTEYSPPLFFDL